MKFCYSTDRSTIKIQRKYCVIHFKGKNPSSINMIKSLVKRFKTCGTVTDHPQRGHCKSSGMETGNKAFFLSFFISQSFMGHPAVLL